MTDIKNIFSTRKDILIRFLYTILYLIVFEAIKTIIQIIVLFQYIYLLLTQNHNEPVRLFSNKVSTYAYKIMRYMTLCENMRPFPFNNFPEEMEKPEDDVVNFK